MDNSNYSSIIWLTQGKYTIVDNEDYEYLMQWKWHYASWATGYAKRLFSREGKRVAIPMHRVVMNAPRGMVVDHINGGSLDNRKNNLRVCTIKENNRNKKPRKGGTSEYAGVHFHTITNCWRAVIKVDGIKSHLGSYDNEELAARIYEIHAIQRYGEFARESLHLSIDEQSELWEFYHSPERKLRERKGA